LSHTIAQLTALHFNQSKAALAILASRPKVSTERALSSVVVMAMLSALALVPLPVQPVYAAGPFTVSTTADTHDANAGNGVCADLGKRLCGENF
jgi:hypothetical protein